MLTHTLSLYSVESISICGSVLISVLGPRGFSAWITSYGCRREIRPGGFGRIIELSGPGRLIRGCGIRSLEMRVGRGSGRGLLATPIT